MVKQGLVYIPLNINKVIYHQNRNNDYLKNIAMGQIKPGGCCSSQPTSRTINLLVL